MSKSRSKSKNKSKKTSGSCKIKKNWKNSVSVSSKSENENDSGSQSQSIGSDFQQLSCLDPANNFVGFGSGREDVVALIKIDHVRGSQREPCGWSPATCFQWNISNFQSWPAAWLDFFASWSLRRSGIIKKPIDEATPQIEQITRLQEIVPRVVIVFLRKVPCRGGENSGSSSGSGSGSGSGGRSDSADYGSRSVVYDDGSEESASRSGSRGGCGGERGCRPHCKKKRRQCKCYPRCCPPRCGSNENTNFSDWEDRGWVQEEVIIILYNVRFLASNLLFGEQCRNRNAVGCGTCGIGINGPLNPIDVVGGPGQIGFNQWQVEGRGNNFPDHNRGLGEEQILLEFSYAKLKIRKRDPFANCILWQSERVIPW